VANSRTALVRYRMTFGIIHRFPMNRVLTAGPIGTHRADNAARFAGVAALVKRGVLALGTASRWTRNYYFPRSHGEKPLPILAHSVVSQLCNNSQLLGAWRTLGSPCAGPNYWFVA
jgi:hypothetical protein